MDAQVRKSKMIGHHTPYPEMNEERQLLNTHPQSEIEPNLLFLSKLLQRNFF